MSRYHQVKKRQKIGQLSRTKPILVAFKLNFSEEGEGKALCDQMASGTLGIDGELSKVDQASSEKVCIEYPNFSPALAWGVSFA